MMPIVRYLLSDELPSNDLEAKKIQIYAKKYTMMSGKFYKMVK